MSETNFYFANIRFPQVKLYEFGDGELEDIAELRRAALYEYVDRSDVVHTEVDDGSVWRFGEVTEEDGVIIGKFGRSFTEEQTKWDEEEEDYITNREEVELADVSIFAIFPDFGVIAFNRKHHIGPQQFITAFANGYNTLNEGERQLEMSLVRTGGEETFQEVAATANQLKKVRFNLEPTNPYPDEDMAILDDHIRDMNADSFEMEVEAEGEEDSLNPEEDFMRSGAAMSDVGDYGEYEITYLDREGEVREYNSRGTPVTEEVKEPDTPGGLIPSLRDLSSKIEYVKRFKSESDNDD